MLTKIENAVIEIASGRGYTDSDRSINAASDLINDIETVLCNDDALSGRQKLFVTDCAIKLSAVRGLSAASAVELAVQLSRGLSERTNAEAVWKKAVTTRRRNKGATK